MPRPVKCRRVCELPRVSELTPRPGRGTEETVLTVDEYEVIRLMDWLGLTQEEAAEQMSVSRTTVQSIYDGARRKLADVLVNGKRLVIAGGCYEVCGRSGSCCGKGCKNISCRRKSCEKQERNGTRLKENFNLTYLGLFPLGKSPSGKGMGIKMRIAVTYDQGTVFQHFGHCESFKIYEVEDNAVKSTEVVSAVGSGHGALAGFLKDRGVDILICGGIGGGARTALAEAGIRLYPGVQGDADESVAALLNGTLAFDPDTVCSHHHEGGHTCGENKHGCGGN